VAARLNHRNVIRVFDIVESGGCPWIVMELLPYRAVLTDFGIAWAADSPAATTVGVLLGSPSYIAPERARGGYSGAPGDLWGLGASLYTTVEGHPSFERANALASITAVVTDELPPATHAGPLWPVLSGLLRKNPDQRLDAAETERMLRRVRTAPAYVASPATPSPRRSQGTLAAAIGSAALAVLAAGGTAVGLGLTSSSQNQPASSSVVAPPSPGQHAPGNGHHAPEQASPPAHDRPDVAGEDLEPPLRPVHTDPETATWSRVFPVTQGRRRRQPELAANHQVARAERVQEVRGVEGLSGRGGALYLRATVDEAPGCLDDKRCRDGVDVASSR
jgi:eukaryotic-like serine/threonine-protein kinase